MVAKVHQVLRFREVQVMTRIARNLSTFFTSIPMTVRFEFPYRHFRSVKVVWDAAHELARRPSPPMNEETLSVVGKLGAIAITMS